MIKQAQCLPLMQGDMIGLVAFNLVLRVVLTRMMDIAFVVHIARMHPDDMTANPAGFGIPTYVISDFEDRCHDAIPLRTKIYQRAVFIRPT